MNRTKQILNKTSLVAALLVVGAVVLMLMKASGQEPTDKRETAATEQWEYLAVAGPSSTNLTPTGNSRMRKEPNVPFGREAFVLEQHLDKLGANGWELVAIGGPPTDPAYYFKRRK
jgi:hypothetical protein